MTEQAIHAIKKIEKFSRAVFWTILGLIVFLGLAYMYYINQTIWNVAARERTINEIASINSQLGEKEFEYMKSKGSVTMEVAKQMGFSQPKRVSFVTKEIFKTVAMR